MSARSTELVSSVMRKVRSTETAPEKSLRKALWHLGLRYRLYGSKLPGKPDIVFGGKRLAIFVDGDFWHGRQWETRGFTSLEGQMSRVHGAEYWIRKISRNMERDTQVNNDLHRLGWRVYRVWESRLKKDLDNVAHEIFEIVKGQSSDH